MTCGFDCDGCAAYGRLLADLVELSTCEARQVLAIRPLAMAAFHGNQNERAWRDIVCGIQAIVRDAGPQTTSSAALRRLKGFLAESFDLVSRESVSFARRKRSPQRMRVKRAR